MILALCVAALAAGGVLLSFAKQALYVLALG